MRFDDDFDNDSNSVSSVMYMVLGVSFFILFLFGVILLVNKDDNSSDHHSATVKERETVDEITVSSLTADDLDIWDMYPVEETLSQEDSTEADKNKPEPTLSAEERQAKIDEEMNDGKHYRLELADGTHEWLTINPSIEKNKIDPVDLVSNNGYLKYYGGGRSFLGIDISKYNGNIDFARVKSSGIDYCMIRVGARGYKTGILTMDDNFSTNIAAATEAGLDVGVYFYSQAISVEEAVEEANYVIDAIKDYQIKYPVAIDMELVDNDLSRVETLSKDERTSITAAFLNQISSAGYRPMIYGNKEWLMKKITLSSFDSSMIWLSDPADNTDYPYNFSMWQYSNTGLVDGVDTEVDMNICFVDYSAM
ncbi:MAG: glycoside hydrolase family 25 protein [Lachnospiraceae bacterium]|nr:glycoside hydrolase family 25 protein [Lachnospiraceae bacterium]